MASRPFATINVALETDEEPPDLIGGNVKVSASFSTTSLPLLEQHHLSSLVSHGRCHSSLVCVEWQLSRVASSTVVSVITATEVRDIPHTICFTSSLNLNSLRWFCEFAASQGI